MVLIIIVYSILHFLKIMRKGSLHYISHTRDGQQPSPGQGRVGALLIQLKRAPSKKFARPSARSESQHGRRGCAFAQDVSAPAP